MLIRTSIPLDLFFLFVACKLVGTFNGFIPCKHEEKKFFPLSDNVLNNQSKRQLPLFSNFTYM